jgi:hypothetical protein
MICFCAGSQCSEGRMSGGGAKAGLKATRRHCMLPRSSSNMALRSVEYSPSPKVTRLLRAGTCVRPGPIK